MRMGITLFGNCGANDRRMMRALPLHRDSHGIRGNPTRRTLIVFVPIPSPPLVVSKRHRRVNLREGCGKNQTEEGGVRGSVDSVASSSIGITFPGNTG